MAIPKKKASPKTKPLAAVRGNSLFVAIGAPASGSLRPVHALTGMEKIQKVREGISKNDLEVLKEKTGLDYDSLARIFSVAKATLFNKKGEEKFNPSLSEKIFALAHLYSYGYEVFGAPDLFNKWMEQSNKALGGQAPMDLLDTIFGIEEIYHLAGRVAYGVFS
ncbi:antitoxin Xre/MbcA/ParS toxin-binding domain-containing protein [Paraflavisolibacter sp. H34]|uniref:type II RES/Xre toxin-antitoxin system antitoxin n=1 Tax=Huijunlia imazamoxiresistens TaxID=3127457 RepID=UPI00301AB1E1